MDTAVWQHGGHCEQTDASRLMSLVAHAFLKLSSRKLCKSGDANADFP